ncbi:MAG: toxin-antitoxin system protein [Bryobacterales bacterium]|nr:toxin-antitoxin system protein [Bryobacterales bacterium]
MSTTTESPNIRISSHSKATLRDLAKREGKPMQAVLDKAIEQYRRDTFFRELNESYGRLQADPEAWKQEMGERQEWDTALMDGLDGE